MRFSASFSEVQGPDTALYSIPQFDAFATAYRVVRYDLRNHGSSKGVPGEFRDFDDLLGLLDQLDIERAALVGLSLGARIAIDFAIAHPGRVDALVLASPGVSGYEFESEAVTRNSEGMIRAAGEGDLQAAVEHFQRSWTDGPQRYPPQVDPSVREAVRAIAMDTVRAWNIETGEAIDDLELGSVVVKDLTFSPDGKELVGSSGSMLRCWDLKTRKVKRTLKSAHANDQLSQFDFSADGKQIAAINSRDNRFWNSTRKNLINVWDVESGRLLPKVATPGSARAWTSLVFSPDGKSIVTGSSAGYIRVMDRIAIKAREYASGHTCIRCLAVSPDGKTIATGGGRSPRGEGEDNAIRLRSFETGMGFLVISSVVMMVGNLVSDLAVAFVDPRVRFE